MKLLRIGIITTDFSPTYGGIATLAESLSLHLSQSSEVEKVCVIAMKNKYDSVENVSEKLVVKRYGAKSLIGMCLITWKAMLSIRDCDVFHATTVFPIGLITLIFGKYILRKPVFVSYHGTDLLTTHGRMLTKLAKRWTFIHATKAIAVGLFTRKSVEEKMRIPVGYSAVISYALPNSVEMVSELEKEAIKNEFKIKDSDFVVLFVGNIVARKGVSDLFDAVATISDENIKLIFVGIGPEKNILENKCKELGLENKIYFAGRREKISPFYSIADVFCMPSYYDKKNGDVEGLGIVFLEAAQYGVPSIGTWSGGIPDAILDNQTGFLVPERDISTIKEKIIFLKNNDIVRRTLGENAKKFVKEKFDPRKVVSSHINLYRSFLI